MIYRYTKLHTYLCPFQVYRDPELKESRERDHIPC